MLEPSRRHPYPLSFDRFVRCVWHLLDLYPGRVTSWIRSSQSNAIVGGVSNSRHIVGLAVDIVLDNVYDKVKFMRHAEAFGLQAIDERTHIHIEVDGWDTADGTTKTTTM